MTTRPGYIWSGTEWVAIGQEAIVSPFKLQATPPANPSTGDIWVDSDAVVSGLNQNDFLLKADVPTTAVYKMNTGTTAQRPAGSAGMFRYNTTTGYPEWYNPEDNTWLNFYQQRPVPIEYFVVGGGGGGGGLWLNVNWGTGGYGGYVAQSTITSEKGNSFQITVGAGGVGGGGNNVPGTVGSASTFGAITANGGAGGPSDGTGLGGDGAGNVNNNINAFGGIGVTYQSVKYAGGGSGGNNGGAPNAPADHGVNYGGGWASEGFGVYAYPVANRGGGGMGGWGGNNIPGVQGGSGIVILSYPDTFPAFTSVGAGLTHTVSTTSRPGYRVYTFTAGTGTVIV